MIDSAEFEIYLSSYMCLNIILVNKFVESPSNITQPVGSVAEFRCQHQSIDAVISWLVNGSSPSRVPNVSRSDSGSVSTLTIPSVLEYNGTVVVCEAIIRNGGSPVFKQTPPAILAVIAGMPSEICKCYTVSIFFFL